MFFDLLHFGDGPQAINYFIFCLVAILGALQFVAVRYNRRDLLWFDGQGGHMLSAWLVAGSFIWFFVTDEEIFIPGLAGGELFTIFVIAFILAVPTTRLAAFMLARLSHLPWRAVPGLGAEQSKLRATCKARHQVSQRNLVSGEGVSEKEPMV